MDHLQTDEILFKIFKERKTFTKFMETICGFLQRNTQFRSIDSAEKARLRQIFLETLSLSELGCPTENVTAESKPSAAAVVEINSESGLGLNYLLPVSERISQAQPVVSSSKVFPERMKCGTPYKLHKSVAASKVDVQTYKQGLRRQRKILPKHQEIVQIEKPVKIQHNNFELKRNTKRIYKCTECPEVFVSFRQLKIHEALHTTQADVGISVCAYCCSLYANTETLHKHVNECHANGRYLCVPCAKTYKSRGQLLKHVNSSAHNTNSLLYYCSLCPRSENSYIEFTSKAALQKHYQDTHLLMPTCQDEDDVEIEMNEEFLDEFLLSNVNENSFNFSECWDALDLNLPDMLRLTNAVEESSHHTDKIETNHSSDTRFKCPTCNEGISSQKLLLQHLAQKHELPVLICNKCESSFKDYAQWIHHKNTHRIQFDKARNVKNNSLQCEICDKILRSNATLNYHVKTHLRNLLQTPHECPYCRKHFHSDTSFKKHIRIVHAQTKRHICELCDKPFATLDHLKKHVLSQHQNERKHICHICAKSFTQLCHLKQHLAIHTTGKTHQCIKCDGKFWRKIDLQRHMLKNHT